MRARLVMFAAIALLLSSTYSTFMTPTSSAAASLHYLFGSGSQTGGKRITLRIKLTEPAPSGGVVIDLSSSDPAVEVPATQRVNTGETEKTFTVATNAVMNDTEVMISASYGGITKSRSVLIKAPVLTSLGLQSVIRHGGVGKVIVRLSGPAPDDGLIVPAGPATGFSVFAETSPEEFLLLDETIIVPSGQSSVSLAVPAFLIQVKDAAEPEQTIPDQSVDVTISFGTTEFTKTTIIRDFGDDPRPPVTPTATNTLVPPTATATATNSAVPPTATNTLVPPTSTATVTNTPVPPTATNTLVPPTSTATVTNTPVPPTATNTLVPPTSTATATPDAGLSQGCTVMNNPIYDAEYSLVNLFSQPFLAGEYIEIRASVAQTLSASDNFDITLNANDVLDRPIPGMFFYTVPGATLIDLTWTAAGGSTGDHAVWSVSCVGPTT